MIDLDPKHLTHGYKLPLVSFSALAEWPVGKLFNTKQRTELHRDASEQ